MSGIAKKTILLVEDEVLLAMSEKMALERYGYSVQTENSGEKAIEVVEHNPGIDLVLMDIDLGKGIDGTQAAEVILRSHDLPILFVSSHCERDIVEKTEKITNYGYVVKSSNFTVIDASIKMAFKLFDANRAIKENEAIQKAMISNISDVIGIIDVDGVYTYKSPNIEKWFGWKPEDLVGTDVKLTVHPDDLERFQEEFLVLLGHDTSSTHFECRYRCKDGSYRPIELTATNLIGDPAVRGVLMNYHDISERKRSMKALQEKNEEYEVINVELKSTMEELQALNEELKTAGNESRESDNKYRLLAEFSSDIVFSVDEKGAYHFVNSVFASLMGRSPGDIIGKTFWDILPKPDADARHDMVKKAFDTGEKEAGEISLTLQDRLTHYSCTINPIKDKSGKVVFAMIHGMDITERKKAEEALRKSEEKFKALFYNAQVALFRTSISGSKILEINERYANMAGYSSIEDCMARFSLADAWVDADGREKLLGILRQKGSVSDYEAEIIRGDGVHIWILFSATMFPEQGFLEGSIVEITERKWAEEALRESEERFNLAIECTGAGVWDWDMVNDKVVYSARWKSMLGYADHEIENSFSGWKNLWHPDDEARIEKALDDFLTGKTVKYEIIHRCRHKDGGWRWIVTRGDIIRNAQGKPVRWVGTNIDITERKLDEVRIESLLAQKEIILKEVHHRIKNNMNTIGSLLSLQARQLTDPSAISALNDTGGRVKSLMTLYEKLYRSADFANVPVKDYLPALVDEILENFPNGRLVKVEKHIDEFLLEDKILQPLGIIINELLTNIMKYAFSGRTDGSITVSATKTDGHVAISLQDNGCGMPESVSFEHPSGFGLQLVHALTQQLNGTIRIERGNGTRIELGFDVGA